MAGTSESCVVTIPIAALSRLNHHARSRGGRGTARKAIYAYKSLAALELASEGKAALRFVKWTGKCNRCDNGRFNHWSWGDGHYVSCRDCGGTGLRTLCFAETTLPDGLVWHHPFPSPGYDIACEAIGLHLDDKGDYRSRDGALIGWGSPGFWEPNAPAEALERNNLVTLLNEVEDWVEAHHGRSACSWLYKQAKRYLHLPDQKPAWDEPSYSYQIDLGKAPGGCFVCGDDGDLDTICFGRATPLFHWSLPVCKGHRSSPHPDGPPPEVMITPEIRRWRERHEMDQQNSFGAPLCQA